MIHNLSIVLEQWPQFASGLFNTIWLCLVSATASFLIATAVAMPLMSKSIVVRRVAQFVVDGIRCVPFLLLAYIFYYCLPALGIRFSSWTAGLLSLIVYNTAYFSEILRGAWSHLPREQEETGRAFGYSGFRLFLRIVAPQIFIAAAPVLGNQFIQLIKDSAFLMIITIPELTFAANYVQSRYFVPFETLVLAMLLYWLLCKGVEFLVKRLETIAAVRRSA
jgi:polar amino acid transport system permease protein